MKNVQMKNKILHPVPLVPALRFNHILNICFYFALMIISIILIILEVLTFRIIITLWQKIIEKHSLLVVYCLISLSVVYLPINSYHIG